MLNKHLDFAVEQQEEVKRMENTFTGIMQGLQESLDYVNGVGEAKVTHIVSFKPLQDFSGKEIRELRLRSGMTQLALADYTGVSIKTVQAWEQGVNTPNGPSRRLLELLKEGMLYQLPFTVRDNR